MRFFTLNIRKLRTGLSMRAAITVLALLAPVVIAAAEGMLRGVVRDTNGRALAGALVTLSDTERGVSESVYTSRTGRFEIHPALISGHLHLRVRQPYFRDFDGEVQLAAMASRQIVLRSIEDPREISETLPAVFHFGHIAFQPGTPFDRAQFQRDCLSCHQLGNSTTRMVRSVDGWENTIARMHKYLGNFDAGLRTRRARLLADAFNGQPLAIRPRFPFDPAVTRAVITEYRLAGTFLPHDAEISPHGGLAFIADQFGDQIAITDLASGVTRLRPAPHEGMMVGGKFARLGIPAMGDAASRLYRGPHSLAVGPDGRWYTTDTFATQIGVFNPKTDAWEESYDIPDGPTPSLYPHTIRFDSTGKAWFTLAFSEQVGRLDPVSRAVTVLSLPPGKSLGVAAGTVPYGIDVNPIDGSVWYARLWGDRIGRIDPQTLVITEHDSPVRGPRRLRFDSHGMLWIAGYSDGVVARVDPKTFEAERFPLPEFAPGYRPAAYALAIDPRTESVWVNETMTDHIYRFNPATKRWVAYPLPLRGSYTREISFTGDGRVCTSNNPFPAGALEGGTPELICVDPDGAAAFH
ncbi:MAG TPA: carboxypeptidase regulatory-like domain-containing protein [Steroidobacteraceae bacterium]|nr:carboxypeptidase regulatory-like domain-containing protein [Steroidobacteraceae bacterium]